MSDLDYINYGQYASSSNPSESSDEPRRDRYGRRIPGQSRPSNSSRPQYARSDSNNSSLDPDDSISNQGSEGYRSGGRSNNNPYGSSSRRPGPDSYGSHVDRARQNAQAWSLQRGANRQAAYRPYGEMTIGQQVAHATPRNNPPQNRRRRPPSDSSSERPPSTSSVSTSEISEATSDRRNAFDESLSNSEGELNPQDDVVSGVDDEAYDRHYSRRQRPGQQYGRGYGASSGSRYDWTADL